MITMEKSPSYAMYYCKTAERLRTALPSVKMITLLRDPVERTYSSFYHHCRHHGRLKVRQTALPSPRARVASCAPPPLPRRHRVSVAASRLTGRRADAADAHQHMAGPRVWAGQGRVRRVLRDFGGSRHGGLRRRRPTDCRAGPRRARVQVNESGKFVLDGSKRGTPLRPPECTPEKFNQYIADVFRFYECAPHPVPRGQALALH